MSLVQEDARTQRIAGAALIALVGMGIAWVLLATGMSLGRGVRFEVEMATPGQLQPGANIMLAGRVVGEVRGMRHLPAAGSSTEIGAERHVLADCFVKSEWAPHVHTNSDVFVSTPSILGEAYMEIGAPRKGAEPGPMITDGARIRGADPPSIDRMLQKVYRNVTDALLLLREHRPAFDELLHAVDSMLATLSGIPVEKGQLTRIKDGAVRAFEDVTAIVDALRDAKTWPRAKALAADLGRIADELRPELRELSRKADLAEERARVLGGTIKSQDVDRAKSAFRTLSDAARRGEQIAADLSELGKRIDRGEGTAGGLMRDRELFDDLHETHRILKWSGWRLIVKNPPGKATAPEK
jgi:hypothetical protein